jgi:hypothetical protein
MLEGDPYQTKALDDLRSSQRRIRLALDHLMPDSRVFGSPGSVDPHHAELVLRLRVQEEIEERAGSVDQWVALADARTAGRALFTGKESVLGRANDRTARPQDGELRAFARLMDAEIESATESVETLPDGIAMGNIHTLLLMADACTGWTA